MRVVSDGHWSAVIDGISHAVRSRRRAPWRTRCGIDFVWVSHLPRGRKTARLGRGAVDCMSCLVAHGRGQVEFVGQQEGG